MTREDARLCIRRHATSKLRTFEDLTRLRTLGFRGEALPSIASVSELTILTRTRACAAGTRIDVRAGELVDVSDVGTAPGTTIDVRNLFAAVPARLKFLKSRPTEASAIFDACMRSALAHPSLRLVVTHEGRTVREYLPMPDAATRAEAAFPDERFTRVAGERDGVTLLAMLGPPERARTGARGLHLLVNGRPVVDVRLARAIAFAYGSVLPPGRYPTGVVHLTLPPEEVDVNAHPQKAEVRFARSAAVLDAVTRIVGREIGTRPWSGPAAREDGYWEKRLGGGIARDATDDGYGLARALAAPRLPSVDPGYLRPPSIPPANDTPSIAANARRVSSVPPPRAPSERPANPSPVERTGFYGSLRFLAQVKRTFLVCEGDDGLYVLDQHAVDERVVFHRLRREYAARDVKTQRLLFPERVELHESDVSLVESARDSLLAAGFDCGALGATTVAVHAVPALLAKASPARLLRDFLDETSLAGSRSFGDAVDRALATMACHGAIRAGDVLAREECTALLGALDAIDLFASHCPHGRPVLVTLPFDELERKLGR